MRAGREAAHATAGAATIRHRWLGRMGFAAALRLQEEIVLEHAMHGDTILLLEHEPVYTTGRGGRDENLPRGGAAPDVPVVRIGRGGDVTYHGPGQLVGYPLVDLRARGGDVHRYLRALEEGLIELLASYGLRAGRWPGRTGVWLDPPAADRGCSSGEPALGGAGREVGDAAEGGANRRPARKIASIGIGVRRGIAMHGFALNVSPDLAAFRAIVPCGIPDVRMTSMAAEGVDPLPSVEGVARRAGRLLPRLLEAALPFGVGPTGGGQ